MSKISIVIPEHNRPHRINMSEHMDTMPPPAGTNIDLEKTISKEATYTVATDPNGSDTDSSRQANLKRSKDGKAILNPQPSDHEDDPLNWSWTKKHAVFACLLPGCFLTDWVLTYGTTLFVPQAMEWGMTVPGVANSISGGERL